MNLSYCLTPGYFQCSCPVICTWSTWDKHQCKSIQILCHISESDHNQVSYKTQDFKTELQHLKSSMSESDKVYNTYNLIMNTFSSIYNCQLIFASFTNLALVITISLLLRLSQLTQPPFMALKHIIQSACCTQGNLLSLICQPDI